MPQSIEQPSRVETAGANTKLNSVPGALSIAHIRSSGGWEESGQTPEFDKFTVVLHGSVHVEYAAGSLGVRADQPLVVKLGERVRYSTREIDEADPDASE